MPSIIIIMMLLPVIIAILGQFAVCVCHVTLNNDELCSYDAWNFLLIRICIGARLLNHCVGITVFQSENVS